MPTNHTVLFLTGVSIFDLRNEAFHFFYKKNLLSHLTGGLFLLIYLLSITIFLAALTNIFTPTSKASSSMVKRGWWCG